METDVIYGADVIYGGGRHLWGTDVIYGADVISGKKVIHGEPVRTGLSAAKPIHCLWTAGAFCKKSQWTLGAI